MTAPLEGITVLEFSHFIAGPYAGQTLADHGADVIKVEPLNGETSRRSGPFMDDASIYFDTMNRNKRSFAVDLKSRNGTAIVNKLIASCDVLITNYAVGVPERLGFGYETVERLNPAAVMVHVSGYGLSGPNKNEAAFDGVVQALSGLSHLTGQVDGPPLKAGVFVADYVAAFNAVIGVLLGLQGRNVTGTGRLVDVSMLDGLTSMLLTNLSETAVLDDAPQRNGARSKNVFATNFPTSDGYVYIAPLTDEMWVSFIQIIELDTTAFAPYDLTRVEDRLANYEKLEATVSTWTRKHPAASVVNAMSGAGIPCGRVNTMEDVLQSEQLSKRNMLVEQPFGDRKIVVPGTTVKLSDANPVVREAPGLGADTSEILTELGFSDNEIMQLEVDNTIRCATPTSGGSNPNV